MATPLQGYMNNLQGNSTPLQGSSSYLQGNTQTIQGPKPPKPVQPKKVTYGNSAATSPAKQQFINSLKPDNATFNATNPQVDTAGGAFGFMNDKPTQPPTPPSSESQTPAPDPYSGYKNAYQKYIESLTPSSEVTGAKQKYMDFVSSAESGIAGLEGQGRGIPLSLVRGQQKKLADQAEITASRLQGDVELAQGTQTANQNATLAGANFQKNLLDLGKSDLTSVAPGSSLVDPRTGKAVFTAPSAEKAPTLPASAQEYEYAKQQGFKGSYQEYQNEDANRKRAVTNIIGSSGLSNQQAGLFNSIVGKYNSSPLVMAADRTPVLNDTIKQIKADPSNGTLQLNLAYSYIQALDTYQSAVREGELGLVNSIDSSIGKFSNSVQKMTNGQIVRPEVALEIASAAQKIVDTINNAAKSKAKSFASQAQTVGLGDAWNSYMAGFSPTYSSESPNGQSSNPLKLKGYD